jgi:hypothetical protein
MGEDILDNMEKKEDLSEKERLREEYPEIVMKIRDRKDDRDFGFILKLFLLFLFVTVPLMLVYFANIYFGRIGIISAAALSFIIILILFYKYFLYD